MHQRRNQSAHEIENIVINWRTFGEAGIRVLRRNTLRFKTVLGQLAQQCYLSLTKTVYMSALERGAPA